MDRQANITNPLSVIDKLFEQISNEQGATQAAVQQLATKAELHFSECFSGEALKLVCLTTITLFS